MLTLSLVESGIGKEKLQPIDLQLIVKTTLDGLQQLIKNKKAIIETSYESNLPQIKANADEMLKAVENIISNALKYSAEEKQIKISVISQRNSEANLKDYPKRQNFVVFKVEDEGEGIAQKNISRLTERFYRVDKGRSLAMGSTGLGLSIVNEIVKNHNGLLEIKSTLGEGTIVMIYLPV